MIYLAAPFFNEVQLQRLTTIEDQLKKHQIEFFSPRLIGGVLNDMPALQRAASLAGVFKSNVDGIIGSSLVLAGLDDKDTGTTWELGFAYGVSNWPLGDPLPIVTYSFEKVKANLMLAQATNLHLNGHGAVAHFINRLAYWLRSTQPTERINPKREQIKLFIEHSTVSKDTDLEVSE
jgi:nucleoside 2-deoxyribosyltransferase